MHHGKARDEWRLVDTRDCRNRPCSERWKGGSEVAADAPLVCLKDLDSGTGFAERRLGCEVCRAAT